MSWFESRAVCWLLVLLVIAGAVTPPVFADSPTVTNREIETLRITVALDHADKLHGTVRDHQGHLAADAVVVLGRNGRVVRRARTDKSGRFEIGSVKPGYYEIASKDAAAFLNVLSAKQAEDTSTSVEVSRAATLARGQNPDQTILFRSIIGLVLAAAIAIPFVVDDDDDAS